MTERNEGEVKKFSFFPPQLNFGKKREENRFQLRRLAWVRSEGATKSSSSSSYLTFGKKKKRNELQSTRLEREWKLPKILVFEPAGGIFYATIINGFSFFDGQTEAMNIELSQSLKSDVFVFLSFSWKYDQWKSQSSQQEGNTSKKIFPLERKIQKSTLV